MEAMPRDRSSQTKPQPKLEALILDLDGTLVCSSQLFHRAATRVLRRLAEARGNAFEPVPHAFTDRLLGLPWRELIAGLAPDADEAERERLTLWLHEEESALLRSELGEGILFPGALAALDAARARGIRLAIASNCQDFYLQAVLRSTGLGSRIDLPLCLSTPGIRSKTDMVAHALAHFGTRKALVIGDRIHDLEAAAAHGVPFLRFTGASYGAGDELAEAVSFDHWNDFESALGQLA